ncbi:MAG: ABC transporter permease, partial [Rhodococcus sp. (in: high G+C Gram-positive bacteria)]
MLRFMVSRLLTLLPMLLILTIIVFLLVEIAPGDPAAIISGADASPEAVEAVRQRLGLDQPVWQQYVTYVWNALHGDLGVSFATNEPVTDIIARRLPRTLSIGLFAMLMVVILS